MNPYYADNSVTIYHGDCLDVLRELPDCSVDSVVTDPPYGLEFMGKEWDKFKTGRGGKYAKGGDLNLDDIAAQSGKGGAGPVYVSRPAKRCNICGKQAWSGSPCKCPEPEWVMDNSPLYSFQAWCQLWAAECLRILKPGGHMLAFGGTRTSHRLACAIEDAGFEIRDSIAWLYGSGFPKSLDVSKAIDRANGKHDRDLTVFGDYVRERRQAKGWSLRDVDQAMGTNTAASWWEGRKSGVQPPSVAMYQRLKIVLGMDDRHDELVEWAEAEREKLGERFVPAGHAFAGSTYGGDSSNKVTDVTAPATDAAQQWQGWGTALKPAHEPIVVARKPLVGTVAGNVLAYGTGALNIDATRIAGDVPSTVQGQSGNAGTIYGADQRTLREFTPSPAGRWPSNVVLDEDQAAALDQMSGELTSGTLAAHHVRNPKAAGILGAYGSAEGERGFGDSGGASRFFYTSKASTDERITHNGTAHPTVKPLDLMRWLVRLVTPPGGLICEPFAGSGTTVEAAILEGFRCVAVEREADYLPLITQRIHRRRDPIAYLTEGGHDLGLFAEDEDEPPPKPSGRWPANVVMDESQADALDQMSGETTSQHSDRGPQAGVFRLDGFSTPEELRLAAERGDKTPNGRNATETYRRYLDRAGADNQRGHADSGGASRFFFVAKSDDVTADGGAA